MLIRLSQNINRIADLNYYSSVLELRYKKISWHGAADFSLRAFCREQHTAHSYLLLQCHQPRNLRHEICRGWTEPQHRCWVGKMRG